jgi:hypothetical protein
LQELGLTGVALGQLFQELAYGCVLHWENLRIGEKNCGVAAWNYANKACVHA